jgi:hypothetical protein
MKTQRTITRGLALRLLVIAAIISSMLIMPAWAGNGTGQSKIPLNDDEVSYLNFTREEEKLARDVYMLMYETWNAEIFARIAVSEQQHMDTMLKMLDKYGLTDPASAERGIFNNVELQGLYDFLVAKGDDSFIDGLEVGVIIEETDIVDLQEAIAFTDHVDLVTAYEHLIEGSKNHLRAFVDTLEKQGVTSEPQVISQELFDAIIDIP